VNGGDRFGRYQIVRLIGRGAMGEVYLARDTEAGAEVALKVVYKGPDPEDEDVMDAERLGAELQKRLSGADKRVVTVNQYGEIGGDLFIEMEFIAGEDLSTVMARGPVKPGFAVHVAAELCAMLENLGAFTTAIGDRKFVGIIHGDLKPRNVRLNQQNEVKVLDFGIAKALSDTRRSTTNLFASTAYCSPERLETQNMDTHSDLWSVGVLLYQMIAGRLPFNEPSKERLERRIRSSQVPDALPWSCPPPLRRIIQRMLARDPAQRYQTAREVNEDLLRFQNGHAVSAGDDDATVRTSAPPIPVGDDDTVRSSPIPPPLPEPARHYRANRSVLMFGVVCLLAVTFVAMQLRFWDDADKLKTDLQSERITNLDDAWTRYQALVKRTHLGLLSWGARSALEKRLIAAADEPIVEFRNNDAPAVYKPEWMKAHSYLQRALELDPDDTAVKGRLRLCEGHVARIDASGLRPAARQKQVNTAMNKFDEAAELLKHSPDPYLGLARLYAYEVKDVDKATEALNKAEQNGHPIGKRETAELGDVYRSRADRFWYQSRGMARSLGKERDSLEQARQDYIRAQDLYQQAGLFGDAARNQLQALQGQQRVEQRLSQLHGGPGAP
jgi:serine/threonine protein kinase